MEECNVSMRLQLLDGEVLMAMALIINKVLMDMALRRQSRSTSTFKEEYWYSTFLKVVPFYAHAELLHTPQQCTPRSCTSDAHSTAAP